jgi:putative endopeptidase
MMFPAYCPTMILLFAFFAGSAASQELHSGIDVDGFDRSVRPQDDLYQHAGGRWLLRTEIPADQSSMRPVVKLANSFRVS